MVLRERAQSVWNFVSHMCVCHRGVPDNPGDKMTHPVDKPLSLATPGGITNFRDRIGAQSLVWGILGTWETRLDAFPWESEGGE